MEESVNFVKGYNKVDPNEDDESSVVPCQSPSPKRRRTVAVIITLSLFTIIIGAIIAAALVHRSHTKQQQSEQSAESVKSIEAIKAVCAVTQHPDSCFTGVSSIKSGNVNDPEMILNLTVELAMNELKNISSLPKTLISKSNDLRTGSALRDCASLFDDAVSQLSRSVESVTVLTEAKMGDLKTWISAAMTDLDTCVDGLEEMGSTAVDEVKMKVQRSNELMSNSLAMLANMDVLLDRFGLHLH